MINFRYHVVSIVAVFLALAVGIVMGTTVISESVVDRLEADARDFRSRNGELRQEADRLEQQIAYYDRFGAAVVPPAIRGRLAGRTVVLVVEPAVPDGLTDRVRDALGTAGARPPATVQLTDAWALDDPAIRERLAAMFDGADAADAPGLLGRAAEALGRRLAETASRTANGDRLGAFEAAGMLRVEDAPDAAFPPRDALFLYLSSGSATAIPEPDAFTMPLLRAIGSQRRIVTAEPLDAEESLAERIRGVDELSRGIVTVDHGTSWPGVMSIVEALRRPPGDPAVHYGVRRGATAIAPAIPSAP